MIRNNRSETIAPAKGNEKVADIGKELEGLGLIKESLLSQISDGKKLASEYLGLDAKVLEKQEELKDVSTTIDKLNNIVVSLRSENSKLEKQKEEYHKILDDINTIKNIRDNHKESSEIEINRYNEKMGVITQAIYEKEQELIRLSKEEQLAIDRLEDVNTKCQSESDILNELKDQNSLERQRAKVLAGDIETAKRVAKEIEENSNREMKAVIEQAEKIVSEATSKAEKIMADASDYKDKVEKDLINREGDLSEKTSWLLDKEKTLKETKNELEQFYGRKINNVII